MAVFPQFGDNYRHSGVRALQSHKAVIIELVWHNLGHAFRFNGSRVRIPWNLSSSTRQDVHIEPESCVHIFAGVGNQSHLIWLDLSSLRAEHANIVLDRNL